MQLSEAEEQEWLDYIFQHNYNRVEQAARRLKKKPGKFSMNISFKEGEGLRSSYKVPDEDATMEFAVSIRNFALADQPFNVDEWLKFLRKLGGEQHSSEFDKMENVLGRIKQGTIGLTKNKEKITAYKAYEIMSKRAIFASDIDADAFLKELLKDGPVFHLMWQMYHGYCLDLWQFLQSVHNYRKKYSIRPKPVQRENICIFCKAMNGIFDHVEHTMPESLGNQYSFLPRGYVCGTCKSALDKLEDGIHEMLPFSMSLLTTSYGNKKGKLPSLKSKEVRIKKKSPNRLDLTYFKKVDMKPEPVEGGGYKFTLKTSGRFEVHTIARMLFKAALGGIALEKGRDAVLDARFDSVRRYIIHGGTFPNRMLMFKEGQPSPLIEAHFREQDGVPMVGFVVLGFIFAIILGENPKINPPDELKPQIMIYDLSLEKPEMAVEQMNVESTDSKK